MAGRWLSDAANSFRKTKRILSIFMRLVRLAQAPSIIFMQKNPADIEAGWIRLNNEYDNVMVELREIGEDDLTITAEIAHKSRYAYASELFGRRQTRDLCLSALSELEDIRHNNIDTFDKNSSLTKAMLECKFLLFKAIIDSELREPRRSTLPVSIEHMQHCLHEYERYSSQNRRPGDFFDGPATRFVVAALKVDLLFLRFQTDDTSQKDEIADQLLGQMDIADSTVLGRIANLSEFQRRSTKIMRSIILSEIGVYRKNYDLVLENFNFLRTLVNIPLYLDETYQRKELLLDNMYWVLRSACFLSYPDINQPGPYNETVEATITISHNIVKELAYFGVPSLFSSVNLLCQLYYRKRDDARVVELSSVIFRNLEKIVDSSRSFQQIQYELNELKDLSEIASSSAFRFDENNRDIGGSRSAFWLSESGRSLGWKFGRVRAFSFSEPSRLFDFERISANSMSRYRINVSVTTAFKTASMHVLIYRDGIASYSSHDLPMISNTALSNLLEGEDGWYSQFDRFSSSMSSAYQKERDVAFSCWNTYIKHILEWLWTAFGSVINDVLDDLRVPRGSHLHIVCPAPLSNLPLHSCGHQDGAGIWTCLNDKWVVSLGDSFTHELFDPTEFRTDPASAGSPYWLNVIDPQGDLGLRESAVVLPTGFRSKTLLQSSATKTHVLSHLRLANGALLFCHGYVDKDSPEESGLMLSGTDRITIGDIRALDLLRSPVIILAACETVVADARYQRLEGRSLAAGLLWAGASAVIGAAWSINLRMAANLTQQIIPTNPNNIKAFLEKLTISQRQMRNAHGRIRSDDSANSSSLLVRDIDERNVVRDIEGGISDQRQPANWAAFGCYMR